MIDFKFILDENFLVYYFIERYYKQDKLDISNILKEQIEKLRWDDKFWNRDSVFGTIEENKNSNLFNLIKEEKSFKECFEKSQQYFISVPQNWDKYKNIVIEFITNKLKIKESLPAINVYITWHGGSSRSFGIVWGHVLSETDPAYDAVYLTHEWLHELEKVILPKDEKYSRDVFHAIIELATDFELSKLLGGKTENYRGHTFLNELRSKIENDFKVYMKKDKGNYKDFTIETINKYSRALDTDITKSPTN